jgi:polycystin 1
MVASKAYNLSSALMCILMRSRVLNEEPLTLVGEEILAQGKRSDPLSLLCYGNTSGPGCHFSIPEAFSGALSNLSDVVQLIFLVDSNPFPFGYISNYTVSTKVASMAFQTQAGTQIPIERLAAERAITVKVPNNLDQAAQGSYTPAGSAIIQPRASVSAVVTPDNSNPEAGLHLQLTYTMLNGGYHGWAPVPPGSLQPYPCGGGIYANTIIFVATGTVCLLPYRGLTGGHWSHGRAHAAPDVEGPQSSAHVAPNLQAEGSWGCP